MRDYHRSAMSESNTKGPGNMEVYHIAPCGMNCSLCMAYQREKNRCIGCLGPDDNKPKSCVLCTIKNCDKRNPDEGLGYCFQCEKMPCKRLKQLDKRYTGKYHMSMLENLEMIKEQGIERFIENEINRWTCPNCGQLVSVHRDNCIRCGQRWIDSTSDN